MLRVCLGSVNKAKKPDMKESISEIFWDTHISPHWALNTGVSVHSVPFLKTMLRRHSVFYRHLSFITGSIYYSGKGISALS